MLTLTRFAYSPTETEGRIITPTGELYTMERPWIPGPIGGMPFESCIPDGQYELRAHTRPNGDEVVALVAPELGVYYRKEDRPGIVGRYLVLLHAGNTVQDVVGCIAPGLSRTVYENKRMVTSSRAAMAVLMALRPKSLLIQTTKGAK